MVGGNDSSHDPMPLHFSVFIVYIETHSWRNDTLCVLINMYHVKHLVQTNGSCDGYTFIFIIINHT